jgi:hypothetical protein
MPGFDPHALAGSDGGPQPEGQEAWIATLAGRERQWFELLSHVLMHEQPDLAGGIFDGPARIAERCWRVLDARLLADPPPAADARLRAACLEYFRQLDRYVEALARLAGPDTRVFVASARGVAPATRAFHVNAWLERAGLLRWRATPRREADVPAAIDWSASAACAPLADGIWIQDAERCQGLAEALPLAAHEHGGSPDIVLGPRKGVRVSLLPAHEPVRPLRPVCGAARAGGLLAAAGPGIRPGPLHASVLDVAPALLHSLGLPLPDDLPGRVPPGLFRHAVPLASVSGPQG